MPVPAIFSLIEKAKLAAIQARAAGNVDDERIAMRAAELVGSEIGREWMIGLAYAMEHHGDEAVDCLMAERVDRARRWVEFRKREARLLQFAADKAQAERVKLEDLLRRIEAARA